MAEIAAWQRGHSLQRLKELGLPFQLRHKSLCFGRFGLTSERDIAEALHQKRLLWIGEPLAAACAIARPIKSQASASWRDFRGEELQLMAGCFILKAFAATNNAAGARLLREALKRAGGHLYLELFEEDGAAKALAIAEGFRWLGTRIAAGSEIKGLYASAEIASRDAELPPEERLSLAVLERAFLSAQELEAIRAELAAFAPWEQHYSDYNKRRSWTAFALRGFDWKPEFVIKPAEMSKSWKAEHAGLYGEAPIWTEAMPKFPSVMRALGKLSHQELDFDRIRFMQLREKDGELGRHADITDREAGLADGRIARLHIPIATNPGVSFIGWDERGRRHEKRWPAGALCYLDHRKPHAVKNAGAAARIHLVVDIKSSEALRARIRGAIG